MKTFHGGKKKTYNNLFAELFTSFIMGHMSVQNITITFKLMFRRNYQTPVVNEVILMNPKIKLLLQEFLDIFLSCLILSSFCYSIDEAMVHKQFRKLFYLSIKKAVQKCQVKKTRHYRGNTQNSIPSKIDKKVIRKRPTETLTEGGKYLESTGQPRTGHQSLLFFISRLQVGWLDRCSQENKMPKHLDQNSL